MLFHKIRPNCIPEIVFAHRYSCPEYEYHFKPMTPNIEITYIETGALTLRFRGQEILITEGSFLVMSHKDAYTLKTCRGQNHMHYTVSAGIDSDSSLHDGQLQPAECGIMVPVCLPFCPQTKGLLQTLNTIINEFNMGDDISRLKCGAMVVQLLCDIANAAKQQVKLGGNSVFDILDNRIKRYIDNNIGQKITLNDVAESIGKNANYLNQVFRQKNNVSIIRYINMVRMKKAAGLVMNDNMPLKTVAATVGISDPNYLSRMFKRVMGMTISEYKLHSVDYTFSLEDYHKIY